MNWYSTLLKVNEEPKSVPFARLYKLRTLIQLVFRQGILYQLQIELLVLYVMFKT